jgi:hypothetical protein
MQLAKAVDNLFLYSPVFKDDVERFLRDSGGSSDVYEINTKDDLKTVVNSYRMVKFLEIDTHGSPGAIQLGNKSVIDPLFIADLAATNPNFLQKNARILFDGCNVGEGERGDKLMDELGAKLLKGKGGIIGATTVSNISVPLLWWTGIYMEPFSFGRLKVKKYDINGKPEGSMQVDRHGVQR